MTPKNQLLLYRFQAWSESKYSLRIQFRPHGNFCVSISKTSWLKSSRRIIYVHCENYKNNFHVKKEVQQFWMLKQVVHIEITVLHRVKTGQITDDSRRKVTWPEEDTKVMYVCFLRLSCFGTCFSHCTYFHWLLRESGTVLFPSSQMA